MRFLQDLFWLLAHGAAAIRELQSQGIGSKLEAEEDKPLSLENQWGNLMGYSPEGKNNV
jgi:hypothetical protein